MRSDLPPKNKMPTSTIQKNTKSYFKVFHKIPIDINTKCVFMRYMMNLYYKGIHFILIREGV
jgi:hypothetical protein